MYNIHRRNICIFLLIIPNLQFKNHFLNVSPEYGGCMYVSSCGPELNKNKNSMSEHSFSGLMNEALQNASIYSKKSSHY